MKSMLLLCALIVGSGSVWADTKTLVYSVTSKTAVTLQNTSTGTFSGTVTFANSGSNNNDQMTSGKTMTLTLKSFPYKVTKVSLNLHRNSSNGGGTVSIKHNDVTICSGSKGKGDLTSSYVNYDFSCTDNQTTGDMVVLLTSTENSFWCNLFTITYEEPAVTSLSVKTAPTKVRYEVGETLDMSGFALLADGVEKTSGYTMTMGGAAISNGATLSSAGKKTLTVSYGGKTVDQAISVGAVTVISVTTAPTKTSYNTGDSFDATGMVVTASLSTGEAEDPDTWTKEVTGYTISPDGALAPANTSVTITYSGESTTQAITVTNVAVTGVSVKASTTIEKGKTETLTPTITPANATNKTVTWESDATSVATVTAAGVVTAVSAGTANITVKTDDGDYEATCVVTVVNEKGTIDAPYTVAEVIAMSPGTTASKTDVYVIGYIAGCVNGSNGALNPATPVNSNLALVDDPDDTSSYISVQLPSGDFRTTFNVVDHPYLTGVTQILIKADIIKYCGIPGLKNIDEMSAVAEAVAVTNAGYATYVSDFGLDFSGLGVKAYKATVSGKTISFDKVAEVPAGEGVLLQNEGTFVVPVKTVTAWAAADNAFVRGTGAAVATGDGPYNYILNKVNDVVGFYKANGQTVAKNRAYLQTTTNQARINLFIEDEATGIADIRSQKSNATGEYFDLQGRKVTQPTKGLYIVNGRKVVIR